MKGVDLMNPFRQPEKFTWTGPCVVSSTAGLGDLFIHLPLIAGIANEARRRGIEVQVALRPEHAGVGEACGWNVQHFDNSLEDFFKRPSTLKPSTLIRSIREARRHKSDLWIDLTGSAVSELAIRSAGARKVAARITRGGRSLVNYPLPHTIRESEYDNIFRVAAHIGCELDRSVFDKLLVEQDRETTDAVVLCVTTASRWKNWPLANFLQLIDRFPMSRFAVTGLKSEILTEEKPLLAEVLARPNVLDRFDTPNVMHLVRLIAHASAVITNDTSAAHIANAFEKPGAVLFGPVSPETFAIPNGLRIFVDRSCPFHPCVQWTCHNQENWCMRKIQVAPVADHLAAVLKTSASYAATANVVCETPVSGSNRAIH
jgi:ADP-heptose:LPS heptosyltransferase